MVWDAVDLGLSIRDLVQEKGSDAGKVLRAKAKELEESMEQLGCKCHL
jgi:hypothetical protein